jgi:four helix bundle protein
MRNKGYRNLIVWQQSMSVAEAIYKATGAFPRSEEYGLTTQMRRSAISIPSNIAEGSGRGTNRDQIQFLRSFQSIDNLLRRLEASLAKSG